VAARQNSLMPVSPSTARCSAIIYCKYLLTTVTSSSRYHATTVLAPKCKEALSPG
jgi:hypothetical protein